MAPNRRKTAREGRPDPHRPTLQRVADQGTVIEDGWRSFHRHTGTTDPEEAYKAGASFMFQFLIRMMDDGATETADDMRRMGMLNDEAQKIDRALFLKYGPATKGPGR